jgi:ATP-dependent RNA helicase RhlE
MSFKQFHLHPSIEYAIRRIGYTEPTPIQRQSVPLILHGKDLMGLAQTGTGKTAAFVLPILDRLQAGPRRQPRVLILAPTRELAEQIHEAIGALGQDTALKSVTVYGGVNKNPQSRNLTQRGNHSGLPGACSILRTRARSLFRLEYPRQRRSGPHC